MAVYFYCFNSYICHEFTREKVQIIVDNLERCLDLSLDHSIPISADFVIYKRLFFFFYFFVNKSIFMINIFKINCKLWDMIRLQKNTVVL